MAESGKNKFIRECIANCRVETLILFKKEESKDLAIALSPEQVVELVSFCLENEQPEKAELVLKNFPHAPDDAERVISYLLGFAHDQDEEANRRMFWGRAYDIACVENVALEKVFEYAIAAGYHGKIEALLEQMGRKIYPHERSALFGILLSQDKLPEVFAMADTLSRVDKIRLVKHCAQKGLIEDWQKAMKIAGVASKKIPGVALKDADWLELLAGIEAKSKRHKEIAERNAG
jgi:hypothetical protein